MGLLETLPTVPKFCWCINLRTGTIIIGIMSALQLLAGYGTNVVLLLTKYAAIEIDDGD